MTNCSNCTRTVSEFKPCQNKFELQNGCYAYAYDYELTEQLIRKSKGAVATEINNGLVTESISYTWKLTNSMS
jgi:hypothetical protein